MNLGLEGRRALITGSSHGIGKATAVAFAREGANVIICGRDQKALFDLEDRLINEFNIVVSSHVVEATERTTIAAMFDQVARDNDRIDILVNTVGGAYPFGNFSEIIEEDWVNAYRLNLLSAQYFCDFTLPWLKKSDQGRIINVASLSATQPGMFNPHYAAAKLALISMTKTLSKELAKDQILVNSISPSTVWGDGFKRNARDRALRDKVTPEEAEKIMYQEELKKTDLNKLGSEDEVANLIVYLSSNCAYYITGQNIIIDGGITRGVL